MHKGAVGGKAIKAANRAVNLATIIIVMTLLAYAVYALWDSRQITKAADKSVYERYKPTVENQGKTFVQLQEINEEVIAWISVFGTNIDYPVTQGRDNMKYVDTNAEGRYSLSGSVFLDAGNSRLFDDFNSILYGHHMEKRVMFGEIGGFSDKETFDGHRYGQLYFDGRDHGIEFFAFVHADAYDQSVFTPGLEGADRQAYVDNLLETAMLSRDIGVTIEDQLILLSTCSSGSTNGRDILVGRITDQPFEIPAAFPENDNTAGRNRREGLLEEIQLPLYLSVLLMLIPVTRLLIRIMDRHKAKKGSRRSVRRTKGADSS